MMQIYFKRTGGFIGQPIVRVVDTAVLPSEEVDALRTLVHQADFFDLPTDVTAPSGGQHGDQFEYTLLIDDGDRQRHTIKRSDNAVSDELWPLLREITTLARSEHSRSIDNLPN